MRKALFTVFFMVVLTVVFISVLATVNGVTQKQIRQNLVIQQAKSILYAFGFLPAGVSTGSLSGSTTTADLPWDDATVLQTLMRRTRPMRLPITAMERPYLAKSYLAPGDSITVYAGLDDVGKTMGYGFYLKGKGLWGTIQAFAAVTPDFKHMIGIDFTDQVETPGLGARIIEESFKKYFRNLDIEKIPEDDTAGSIVMVKKMDSMNTQNSTNEFEAVTGATQTTNGVLRMLETDLKFYYYLIHRDGNLI